LITDGDNVMFLMQNGEKKLKEFMNTKTIAKRKAITYLLNCYHNKGWKRKSLAGTKESKRHHQNVTKLQSIWLVNADFSKYKSIQSAAKLLIQKYKKRKIYKKQVQIQFFVKRAKAAK
jgi:hypothetical protein